MNLLTARRPIRLLATLFALATALSVAAGTTLGAAPTPVPESGDARVLAVPLEDAIDPVAVDIVRQSLQRAEDDGYDIVLYEMDTPGGLVSSMNEIVKEFTNTEIAVVVWVTPRTAKAASAGAFITMASDVAAMAPNTTIGSASVVGAQGGDVDETLEKKITNDAVAQITGLARDHGRNEEFAEDAVREAANLEAADALEQNVIEIVAATRSDLFDQMDGLESPYKNLVFQTTAAEISEWKVPTQLKILKLLINPNWIFLMLTLGIIGIGFEVTHPGTIFPGTIGAISFLLAMYGLQVLEPNTAGIALVGLAVVLFVAEVFVASGGMLGIGGSIALVLGGLLLFDRDGAIYVSLPLILVVGAMAGGLFVLIGRKVFEVHKGAVQGAGEGLIAAVGRVRHPLDPRGQVFINGAIWQARSEDGATLAEGTDVRVIEVDGLTLVVEPAGTREPSGVDAE